MNIKILKPLSNYLSNKEFLSTIWLNLEFLSELNYCEGKFVQELENRFISLSNKEILESIKIKADFKKKGLYFFPYSYKFIREYPQLLSYLQSCSKLCQGILIVEYWDDDVNPCTNFNIKNVIIMRTSALKSKLQSHEIIMPSWSDFKGRYLKNEYNKKKNFLYRKPYSLSFCGNLNDNFLSLIKSYFALNLLKLINKNYFFNTSYNYHFSKFIRGYTSKMLLLNNNLNFFRVKHKKFYSGADLNFPSQKMSADLTFVSNSLSSEFSLVMRGMGNFSYRLYEVMELGNLPIILDTDFELPLSKYIDWVSNSIIVSTNNINCIDKIIDDWIAKKYNPDPALFYKKFLSPKSYLKILYNINF